MSDSQRYIATVNGINVGSFSTITEAYNKGVAAINAGVAGPHIMNGPKRLLEVRDSQNAYFCVSKQEF